MKAFELIDIIRHDYLFDTVEPYMWDDNSLLRKIDEAQRQACNRGNLIFDDTTAKYTQITLVEGKASYPIDAKITVISGIRFNGNPVEKKTKENMDVLLPLWRTTTGMTGKTVYAVISGRTITFAPIPDTNDAGKTVYLDTYRLPAEKINDPRYTPEIPEEYHHDLIYWVLHECYKKPRHDESIYDQEKVDYNLARFNQIFGQPVTARVRQHQLESPKSMVILPSAYGAATSIDDEWR